MMHVFKAVLMGSGTLLTFFLIKYLRSTHFNTQWGSGLACTACLRIDGVQPIMCKALWDGNDACLQDHFDEIRNTFYFVPFKMSA